VEAVFDWKAFIEKESKKKSKKNKNCKKQTESVKEEVAVTQEGQEAPAAEAPAQEKPIEVDIAQLFDIKLTGATNAPKKGKAPKKDPLPAATKAVAARVSKEEEEDDILKALDMYFEFKGPKSVMEISDEVTGEPANEEPEE